jgi:hypothetical protein
MTVEEKDGLSLLKLVSNLVFGHSIFELPFSSFLLRYEHRLR